MTVGCSEFTPEKWNRLDYLLGAHVKICRSIMQKLGCLQIYDYFDFYAGPGIYSPDDAGEYRELIGQAGSPIRAIRALNASGIRYRAWLSDECPLITRRLADNLKQVAPCRFVVNPLDCKSAVDWLTGKQNQRFKIGLAFFDPNGQPDWDAIAKFSEAYPYIDLLINVSTALIKRMNNPIHKAKRPTEYLRGLGKKHIYLWDPCPGDKHQFSLAVCINWGQFPKFGTLGFHRIDTAWGRIIADRIDYSRDERIARGTMPGFLPFFTR